MRKFEKLQKLLRKLHNKLLCNCQLFLAKKVLFRNGPTWRKLTTNNYWRKKKSLYFGCCTVLGFLRLLATSFQDRTHVRTFKRIYFSKTENIDERDNLRESYFSKDAIKSKLMNIFETNTRYMQQTLEFVSKFAGTAAASFISFFHY